MGEVKYPDVTVRLVGEDGNAFAIMGRVTEALGRYLTRETDMGTAEVKAEKDAYVAEATSGDYDDLLATTTRWVNVE